MLRFEQIKACNTRRRGVASPSRHCSDPVDLYFVLRSSCAQSVRGRAFELAIALSLCNGLPLCALSRRIIDVLTTAVHSD